MPTLLRFGAYRVMIFTEDHGPAHVHVFGPDSVFVFLLHCTAGPVELRERLRGSAREVTKIARVLNEKSGYALYSVEEPAWRVSS